MFVQTLIKVQKIHVYVEGLLFTFVNFFVCENLLGLKKHAKCIEAQYMIYVGYVDCYFVFHVNRCDI